jgi:mRNA interferase RelE/StbE
MYKVEISRIAQKDLNKIDFKYRPHIWAAMYDLQKNPFLGKRLSGDLKSCYSLRVGDYRILYEVSHKILMILVIRIGHRQGIYK